MNKLLVLLYFALGCLLLYVIKLIWLGTNSPQYKSLHLNRYVISKIDSQFDLQSIVIDEKAFYPSYVTTKKFREIAR